MQEKVFFKSTDGIELCGIWHLPEKSTNKAIVLAHGLTVDKDEGGIFAELAELLKVNGYAVFRFDFRGHGESEGTTLDTTISGELIDISSAIEEATKRDFQNIGLLGASVGGGIAALYSEKNQKKIKCLCLWNPALNYEHTFLNPITPWLREKRDEMKNDLKTKGWTTVGSRKRKYSKKFFEEMEKYHPEESLPKISIPTLLIHGTNDKYVDYQDTKIYVKDLNNARLITIQDGEHGFQVRDSDRRIAKEETLKFFKRYL